MSCVREVIDNVRAFPLPDGITADGCPVSMSRTALVTWRSTLDDMLYQVYVNGRFGGVTIEAEQRQLVVHSPTSLLSPVQIEVVGVEPKDACVDFRETLDGPRTDAGRVTLRLLRSQMLPIAATVSIYSDNGTGTIDYANPVHAEPLPVWPTWQDKAGFGMARFGMGDFGYDCAASIGFGNGTFGHGQFGLDADTLEWTSPVLPLGHYRFGVKVLDVHGNESQAAETAPLTVVPPARPAVGLGIASFDPTTGQLTLSISDSV